MSIKEITKFETLDGYLFNTLHDAKMHLLATQLSYPLDGKRPYAVVLELLKQYDFVKKESE